MTNQPNPDKDKYSTTLIRVSKSVHQQLVELSEVTGVPLRRLTDDALRVLLAQKRDQLTSVNN